MSELQRREEQLELRARELRRTEEDTRLRTQDRLDHMAKVRPSRRRRRARGHPELRLRPRRLQASEKLLQEREELRREVQKASAQTQEARGLLLRARLERDRARTDQGLLKVERDRAVQMCTAAVEERERLERTYQSLEKTYAQKRGRKSPSSSRVDRRTPRDGRRRTSPRGDGNSSSLADSPVHRGRPWKTSPAAQRGGDRMMDAEQVGRDTVLQQQQQQRWSPLKTGDVCLSSGSKGEESEERAGGDGGRAPRTDGGETSEP